MARKRTSRAPREPPANVGHRSDADERIEPGFGGGSNAGPQRPSSRGHASDADERTESNVDRSHR